jgi:chemotaxis response regulator CheB
MIHDSNNREFAVLGIGSSAGGPAILERVLARRERARDRAIPTSSIKVMMKSIARAYGPKTAGVLLTDMFNDRVNETKAIIDSSDVTINAQDEASSLVYGMPKAAGDTGVVDLVASIVDMRARIVDAVEMVVLRVIGD